MKEMTNVEMAKKQLKEALHDLENLSEDRLKYYNSLNEDNDNVYYDAGIVLAHFIGRGLIRGIVNNWKTLIK